MVFPAAKHGADFHSALYMVCQNPIERSKTRLEKGPIKIQKGRKLFLHLDRVIPCANTRADTQRGLLCVYPSIFPQLGGLAIQTTATNQVRIVLQDIGTSDHIHGARLRVSLSGIESFNPSNFIIALTQKGSGFLEDAGTSDSRSLRPGRECPVGSGDGRVYIGVSGDLNVGQWGSVGRVDGLESLAGSGGLDLAIIVELARREREGHGWKGVREMIERGGEKRVDEVDCRTTEWKRTGSQKGSKGIEIDMIKVKGGEKKEMFSKRIRK